MIYSNLCNNNVSKLGIGIMRHDPNNFNKTQQIIDIAMSNGINYFESCYFYLNGKCEQILAKALSKYPRESYYLCGKMSVYGTLDINGNTPESIFEKQLKNNNTSYFDYYLIQAVDRRTIEIIKETNLIPFLQKKKEEGIIHNLGFSFHDTPDVLEEFINMGQWDCVQLQLNYYDWYFSTGKQNYEIVQKYNLPIIVMGGLKGGTLGDRMPKAAFNYVKENPINYAYKFLNTLSNVKVILSGASEENMLMDNIKFFDNEHTFTSEDLAIIKTILKIYRAQNLIDCSGCGYCLSVCPKNIDLKTTFELYNKILQGDKEALQQYVSLQKIEDGSPLNNCINCGRCEFKCPQHLKIRNILNNQIFTLRM